MTIRNILDAKGSNVETVAPDTLVGEAIKTLAEKKIGSLVVLDADKKIVGVLTERDVIWALAERPADQILQNPVSEFMSKKVVVCGENSAVVAVMASLLKKRIRHLPVVSQKNKLKGIVSIGDVLKQRIVELKFGEETRFQHWFEKEGVRTLE